MKTTLIAPDIDEATMRRFWAKVALPDENGCLLWTAGKISEGYGRFVCDGRDVLAHRFTYSALVGEIPAGLVLDHLCRAHACVAPDHLEPVTQAENVRRGDGGKHWAAKTHCPQGHPYSGENLYVIPGSKRNRLCRACRRDRADYQGNPVPRERTHCPRRHEYAGENLYVTPGGKRMCRTCARDRDRARRQKGR